jgi:hypothetical protein
MIEVMRAHSPTRWQFTLRGLLGTVTYCAVASAVLARSPWYGLGALACAAVAVLGLGLVQGLLRLPAGRSRAGDVAIGLGLLAGLWLVAQFGCAALALAGIAIFDALAGGL